MIGKGFRRAKAAGDVETKGFDAFELRLGDLMRGERATMGKSLLDVQRELKIKAAYIAAIENADPTAFDTPGFIAGYVRSYARYLGMEPDWAFDTFCKESGFATAHGMSAEASSVKPTRDKPIGATGKDIFSSSATPFIPANDSFLSKVEPGAVGSVLVLAAVIAALGYGGWTVLQEVQKVQLAPVEQTPVVISEIDPLAGAGAMQVADTLDAVDMPSPEALDRLYRPQALDVPVLVARDAPISTLIPGTSGTLAAPAPAAPEAVLATATEADVAPAATAPLVQVNEGQAPEVAMVAVRPAWVRVRAADGTVIFEGIMNAGDQFALPATEEPASLRVGESGAIYFAVNGVHYGPAGPNGTVTSNVVLGAESLTQTYAVADLTRDDDLAAIVNVAEATTTAVSPAPVNE